MKTDMPAKRNIFSIRFIAVSMLSGMLLVFSGIVSAGGGTWKMGPFGPYWDDNSWPEFTPMYWMEEFLNRINDDDAEIQQWMMRNQSPGMPAAQSPPMATNPANSPWMMQPNYGQPFAQWPAAPSPQMPSRSAPYPEGWAVPGRMEGPSITAPMDRRPPVMAPAQPLMEAPRARSAPLRRPSPAMTERPRPPSPYPEFDHLPNLTPEEFSRMPPRLQQQYEYEFNQALLNYQKRLEFERALKRRPPVYERPRGNSVPQGVPRR